MNKHDLRKNENKKNGNEAIVVKLALLNIMGKDIDKYISAATLIIKACYEISKSTGLNFDYTLNLIIKIILRLERSAVGLESIKDNIKNICDFDLQ